MWWDPAKNSKQDAGLGAGVSWAALGLWCRLPDVWMQSPSWVSVPTSFAASGRNDLTETLSLLSVPNVTTCCCYWCSLYIPDTFLLAALADDVFGGESFRELPFSAAWGCCSHSQLTVLPTSSINYYFFHTTWSYSYTTPMVFQLLWLLGNPQLAALATQTIPCAGC